MPAAEGRAGRAAAAAAAAPTAAAAAATAAASARPPASWGRDESMLRQGVCSGTVPGPRQPSELGGTDCVRALPRFAADVRGVRTENASCNKFQVPMDMAMAARSLTIHLASALLVHPPPFHCVWKPAFAACEYNPLVPRMYMGMLCRCLGGDSLRAFSWSGAAIVAHASCGR